MWEVCDYCGTVTDGRICPKCREGSLKYPGKLGQESPFLVAAKQNLAMRQHDASAAAPAEPAVVQVAQETVEAPAAAVLTPEGHFEETAVAPSNAGTRKHFPDLCIQLCNMC
jgi:hypothetical protein